MYYIVSKYISKAVSKIASQDIGKKWEDKFRDCWKKQYPGRFIYRLPDQQSGMVEQAALTHVIFSVIQEIVF